MLLLIPRGVWHLRATVRPIVTLLCTAVVTKSKTSAASRLLAGEDTGFITETLRGAFSISRPGRDAGRLGVMCLCVIRLDVCTEGLQLLNSHI